MKQFIQPFAKLIQPVLCIAAIALLAVSCKKNGYGSDSNGNTTVQYAGTMMKSASDVTTSATGNVTAAYHTDTHIMNYTVNWQGLTGPPAMMHFFDGTPPSAPSIINITGFPAATSGSISGEATLTADQANDLGAGKLFAQIHTQSFPNGEIMAVLAKTSSSSTGSGY